MPRRAWLAWSWALSVWTQVAAAQPEACPAAEQGWVKVVFRGSAWAPELRHGVLRELGVELGRRSLQACGESQQSTTTPQQVVTLLANDQGLVSILPADLGSEGGFVGRTVQIGAIPEDARALAIAQAVDEALRSDASRPSEPAPPPPKVVAPPSPPPKPSPLVFGAALAPALQFAPATFEGAKRAVVAPGMVLRLSLRSSSFGGSLGVSITRTSELDFGQVTIRQFRLPLDCSVRWRLQAGELEGQMDLGVLMALVDYDRGSSERGYRRVEIGGRAGVSIGWGRRVVPWLGASVEVLPSAAALRLAPTGIFGHTPGLWLGVALGTEIRWP